MKHKHADHMAVYAADALNTDKPWELWESRNMLVKCPKWYTLKSDPVWSKRHEYRRKPNPVPMVYTVHCTLPIKAISPDKAAWQFRELMTSGMGVVYVTEEDGTQHEMMGIRPKGE
jgi:hypothetical protein